MNENAKLRGDPEGRRIARRQAQLLAEGGRLLSAAQALLREAGFDLAPLRSVIASANEAESIALQRGHGPLEGRIHLKGGVGQPLLSGRPEVMLYLDESGTSAINAQQYFALGGVLLTPEEDKAWRFRANAIKEHFFKRTNFSLHEPDMRNRKGNRYYFGGDQQRQAEFDDAVNQALRETEFIVFGAAIRKGPFQQFMDAGLDPYLPAGVYGIAIEVLMERVVDHLATRPDPATGLVCFESIGPRQDAERQEAFTRLLRYGTQWVPEGTFGQWLAPGLDFDVKGYSSPTEIADMFVRDIFEWVRDGCQTGPARWDFFSGRLYRRGDGNRGKFGLKVFPDSDIREQIELHRSICIGI